MPTCDLCQDDATECHGGELYLCDRHWNLWVRHFDLNDGDVDAFLAMYA
jgi:hypothetical protein